MHLTFEELNFRTEVFILYNKCTPHLSIYALYL